MSHATSALMRQLHSLSVPAGHLAVWALGQHGYVLKGAGRVIVIDPYLTGEVEPFQARSTTGFKRQAPIVVAPEALAGVDEVLISHDHSDHCDPGTLLPLLAASPQARVWASYTSRDHLARVGVDTTRIMVPAVDRVIDLSPSLTLTALPSAHYGHEPDADGNPAYLGFLLDIGGVCVYHSGDTILYDGLIERLTPHAIDLACLPINGRDGFRERQGLAGNLDFREAIELTAAIGARVLLPSHNDLFAGNRVNPAYLIDYAWTRLPGQRIHFLQAGELYYYVQEPASGGLTDGTDQSG